MAYMVWQQYKTAVTEGYAGRSRAEVTRHAASARSCREWLQALEIAPKVRSSLVEQIGALEEAFEELLTAGRVSADDGGA